MSGTVTHRVTTPDTGNLPNTSGAFTPAVGDLLVVFVTIEGSTADHALTSSIGGFTFTQVRKELFRTSASALLVYISDAFVSSATSQTVTTPSPGSGSIISVYSISGLSRILVRQQGGQSNQAASGTPAPAFSGAALSVNTCIGAVANATNPAGLTQPASWTESQDTGYTTGAVHGLETAFRNSGETNTTINWGSTSASIFADIILEIDTTALIQLSGSGLGDGVVSGGLNLTIPLGGNCDGTGTCSGSLTVSAPTVNLDGQADGVGTASGGLNLIIPLSGNIDGIATVTGGINLGVLLSGNIDGIGICDGQLSVGSGPPPSGDEYYGGILQLPVNQYLGYRKF